MSHDPLRNRLAMLSRAELVGLAVAVAVLLAGAGLWYVRSLPKPIVVAAEPTPAAGSAGVATSPTASPSPILVDVAGWVRRPGVYEFVPGARVIDAIEAAGGARSGAALEALNLAAPLVDGTQILVPKRGQAPPSAAAGAAGAGTAAGGGLINVNTASAAELETLPGIGEVLAQRIIDHRTEHGPFASVDDLLDVSGIGEVTLAEIRDLVTV
jgi:competence protein ComEA